MSETKRTSIAPRQGIEGSGNHDKCYLTSLPPEIRNYIYELALAPESEDTNFLTAKPPSKALCLTGREIYNEAKAMYDKFYRNFWTTTQFDLQCADYRTCRSEIVRQNFKDALLKRSDKDIAHISNLCFKDLGCQYALTTNGLWYGKICGQSNHREYFFFLQKCMPALVDAGYRVIEPYGVPHFRAIANVGGSLDVSEVEDMKRLAGKVALTKGEIMAMVEWLSHGHDRDECGCAE